ncbi:MAG: D-sedoheptulose 7-phosphate isomerase [Candidatus Lindowbacteria bacterium]|nr:D-sedoheptulose 7-phosphate isomerase [Candidatus Lindowbacteria bacterium]
MIENQTLIRQRIEESIRVKQGFPDKLVQNIARAAETIVEAYNNGGKLILFGNGGSAADAQHIACELVGRFLKERRPLEAMSLSANASMLTCLGNDYGYERVFERQVEAAARAGDVVIGISTSGNSPNVLKAAKRAKQIGCVTICMTGKSGGKMKACADILLNVPSNVTPRIQESHILIGHIICELVEKSVTRDSKLKTRN